MEWNAMEWNEMESWNGIMERNGIMESCKMDVLHEKI